MKTICAITMLFFSLSFLKAQQITEGQIKKLTEKPKNLKGKIIKIQGERFIQLTWGEQPHEDIKELEYLLYVSGICKELALQASIDIRKNRYNYPVHNRFGKLYQFQIKAQYQSERVYVYQFPNKALHEKEYEYTKSPMSDTLSVYVPSKDLPKVNIWPISKDGSIVTLNWKYSDEINDLAGFRLYENGKLILSEEKLTAKSRNWKSNSLQPGKYKYQIEAVSKFDVKSELSQARNFTITTE
ncbi:hypothetical protein KIM67_18185 [Flagellimonas sp. 389]|uniref:hypothetical protein n=1 Tax=Flagellimonas sp. 389 TaxID=2835862 RepID=UPI001BD65116|nr:hypothetical protein [Flagellimonas sp. 389]MBS9464356.1 hypothetical protein [Flagellimonas sp. 389]